MIPKLSIESKYEEIRAGLSCDLLIILQDNTAYAFGSDAVLVQEVAAKVGLVGPQSEFQKGSERVSGLHAVMIPAMMTDMIRQYYTPTGSVGILEFSYSPAVQRRVWLLRTYREVVI